jgi:hypothetical protein
LVTISKLLFKGQILIYLLAERERERERERELSSLSKTYNYTLKTTISQFTQFFRNNYSLIIHILNSNTILKPIFTLNLSHLHNLNRNKINQKRSKKLC